ncbi:hypothetical protein TBR22_A02500 [Luteitalea sp. TBR-22]|uniref:hypothetical protein n=1 Tax=Luteitalea sp. TBR-22 TaxID=2802971 RepID=UPI001AF0A21D|nr:hypothetical protein [Luteitalea sp. TBR-22]BCS31050.1 hypothetical protein TBR22_A02500 [Luteitalea sp. TBR-22]
MTAAELRTLQEPPAGLPQELVALWQDARDDWHGAHATVQDLETRDAAWVHAYLHRKEGDASNARYWYTRADRPVFRGSLHEEWDAIVTALLAHGET